MALVLSQGVASGEGSVVPGVAMQEGAQGLPILILQ